jgi:hypothetical protein
MRRAPRQAKETAIHNSRLHATVAARAQIVYDRRCNIAVVLVDKFDRLLKVQVELLCRGMMRLETPSANH